MFDHTLSYKISLGLALALSAPGLAAADPQISSANLSCAQLQATVNSRGAAVVHYPSRNGLPLYGRAVRNEDFCSNDETTALRYVPAADTVACPLQRCVQDSQSGGR